MKIVQSSWSCGQKELLRFNAGWYAPEYHLMGWALSCLQLTKYYDEVILHADSVSATMLIDKLKLPYNNVICDLDKFNRYSPQLWALPKINTYSQQNNPFLHVDGDVFIFDPFDDELLTGELIAQNKEIGDQNYERFMKDLENGLNYFPSEILKERQNNKKIYTYNAGILGGHNTDFLNVYAEKAKKFVRRNMSCLSKIFIIDFNICFEQYLFYCLAKAHNKKVNVLFNEVIPADEYVNFNDFLDVPHNKQYLHLIGPNKRRKDVCGQLANRLRQDYPEYYYRIIALFKEKKITLKKDHYYFLDQPTEQVLTARHSFLKARFANGELQSTNGPNIDKSSIAIFRAKHIENVIASQLNKKATIKRIRSYSELLKDAKSFEDQLVDIVENKFTLYSKEYLYARDIAHTQYFQFIFENKNDGCTKMIATDTIVSIIQSKFYWPETEPELLAELALLHKPEQPASEVHTAIIPECDRQGYSFAKVDDLDLLLLQILQTPATINELLNETKLSFEPVDLEASLAEFELLITGRIKLALEKKLIRVII